MRVNVNYKLLNLFTQIKHDICSLFRITDDIALFTVFFFFFLLQIGVDLYAIIKETSLKLQKIYQYSADCVESLQIFFFYEKISFCQILNFSEKIKLNV